MKKRLLNVLLISIIFSFPFIGFSNTLSSDRVTHYQTKLQSVSDPKLKIKYYKILIADAKKKKAIGMELQYRLDLAEFYNSNNIVSKYQLSNLFRLGTRYYKQRQWQEAEKQFSDLDQHLGDQKTKLKLLSLRYLSNIARKTGDKQKEEIIHHRYIQLAILTMKPPEVAKNYQHLIKLSEINQTNAQHQYYTEWLVYLDRQTDNAAAIKSLLISWVNFASKSPDRYQDEPFELLEAILEKSAQAEELEKLRILFAQKTPNHEKRLSLCQKIFQINPSTHKWVLAQLLKNTQNEEDQQKEVAILKQWLNKEIIPEERMKVIIKIIKLSLSLKDKGLELEYRLHLNQVLKEQNSKNLLFSRNYYQIASLYYGEKRVKDAAQYFKSFLELEAEMKADDINLSFYYLFQISKSQNKTIEAEFYLSKYLAAVNQITNYKETIALYEVLIELSTKNGASKLHQYYYQWFQKSQSSGSSISQHNILIKWIKFALSNQGKVGEQAVNEMPFDLLIGLQIDLEKWEKANQTRLLLANNIKEPTKKTKLYEAVHWSNLKTGQVTKIGILTHLQQNYHQTGDTLLEQDILILLANRKNYPQRREALRQLTLLSLKNSDWLASLKYHQELIKLVPEADAENHLNILNNLITLAEKTGRQSLLVSHLKTKLFLKNKFIDDTQRYQTFLRISNILENDGDYLEALNISQASLKRLFHNQAFLNKHEIYISSARFSEKLHQQQAAVQFYQWAIESIPKSLTNHSSIALGIEQKILQQTQQLSPGESEIAVLQRIQKYQGQLGLEEDIADTSLIIAQKYEKIGNEKEGLQHYNQALNQYRKVNKAAKVEKLLILLSNRKDGGLEGQKTRLLELEQNQKRSANWAGLITTRLELANFYQQENDLSQALIYYQKTLNTQESQKNKMKAKAGYSAALILSQQEQFTSSNQVLKQLIQQFDDQLTSTLSSMIFHRLAKNQLELNQTKKALETIERSLSYQIADQKYDIFGTKGTILMQMKQFVEAEKLFEEQATLKASPSEVLDNRLNIVKTMLNRNENSKALSLIEELEPKINEQQNDNQLILLLTLKARILYKNHRLNQALLTQEKLVRKVIDQEKTDLLIPESLQLAKFYLLAGQADKSLKTANQLENQLITDSADHMLQKAIIAEVYYKQNNYHQSLGIFESILQKSIVSQLDKAFRGELHYKHGLVQSQLLKFNEAVLSFKQAEQIYQSEGLTYEYFQAGLAKSMTVIKLGKFKETEQNLIKMLNNPKLSERLRGDVNNGLSKLYTESGEFQKALQFSQQAESNYKKAQQVLQIAEMLNLRGMIYIQTKDYEHAGLAFNTAMKQAITQNNPLLESEIANNLGSLYLSLEQYAEARKWFLKTAEIQEKQNFEAGLAITYNNIAAVYLKEQKYPESIELLQEARKIAQKYHLPKEQAQGWNNEGLVYYYQQKLDLAQKAFLESKSLQQQLGQNLELSKTFNNLAMIAQQTNHLEEALTYIQEAIQWISINPLNKDNLFPNPKVNDILAPSLMKNYLLNKGSFQKQISEQKSGVDKIRYLKGAFESFKLSVNLTEIVRGQISGTESQQMLFAKNIDIFQQLISTLYRLGQLDQLSGFHELAYLYSEKSRSRSFLDQLQKQFSKVDLPIPADLQKEELHLNNQITQLEQYIFIELKKPEKERDDGKIKKWQLEKTQTLLSFKQLTKKLERRFPAYAGAKYPVSFDVKQTQARLLSKDNIQLISYFLGEDASYGWAITNKQFKMVKLAPQDDFEKLIRKYRQTLVNPLEFFDDIDEVLIDSTKTHSSVGIQIYRAIIEPLTFENQFNINDLIIIPDGILYYLPFEAIVKNVDPTKTDQYPGGREYLIHRYATQYSSSASVLGIIQQQHQLRMQNSAIVTKNFIGFGDPQFNPSEFKVDDCQSVQKRGIGLKAKKKNKCNKEASKRGITLSKKKSSKKPVLSSGSFKSNPTFEELNFYKLARLSNTERELEEISSIFESNQKSIHLRNEALESRAKQLLQKYHYVHFATHGILDEENPEYSGIMLNIIQPDQPEDGFLQSSEVFRLKLNADLVTLSACETGLGKVIKAEGMVGLTRSFLYAGASSIVVSLWSVADDSTANLMINFYRNISQGANKVNALRKAKLDLMKEDFLIHFIGAPLC